MARRKKSLKFERVFCKNGDPYKSVSWSIRDITKEAKDGRIIFQQRKVEIPTDWSERSAFIAASKYFRGHIGKPNRETSLKQLFDRIVDTIAKKGVDLGYFDLKNSKIFASELKWLLVHQRIAFNSPVFFNVGAVDNPQGSACFILGVDDNLESIVDLQKAEAILFSQGSGAGSNLSRLRSSGEPLSKGGWASGPISFMKGYDAWAGIIRSGGVQRRASKMQRLDDDHPDVWNSKNNGTDFITWKSHEEKKAWALIEMGYSGEFRGEAYESIFGQNCNLSVGLSDTFMQSVLDGGNWRTKEVLTGKIVKEFKAMDMLNAIAEAAWLCGDPGVQFDDRFNEWHTCPKAGRINGTNPCGEFAFIENSACNLASLNLDTFMEVPERNFYEKEFAAAVRLLIVAQDILVDLCGYPTQEIAKNSKKYRPLGLGYCNLGGMLMSMGLPYDSREGRIWASVITAYLTGIAYLTSAEISSVLGPFSDFGANRRSVLKVIRKHRAAVDDINAARQGTSLLTLVEKVQHAWSAAQTAISENGVRNSQVSLIMPTGTVAHMMGAATQGAEPELSLFIEKELDAGGSLIIMSPAIPAALESLGYREEEKARIIEKLKETKNPEKAGIRDHDLAVFDTSFPPAGGKRHVSVDGHLQMMAAIQPFISGAISKTVNLPRSTTRKEIREIVISAWKLGLKSLTVYRSGSKKVQPVADHEGSPRAKVKKNVKRKLPEIRDAKVIKFNIAGQEGFITLGFFPEGDIGECFLTSASEGSTMNGILAALARSISTGLQWNVPIDAYIRQFQNMKFEPMGFTTSDIQHFKKCWSIPDFVAKVFGLFSKPGEMIVPPPRQTEAIPIKPDSKNNPAPKEKKEEEADLFPLFEVCRNCGNLARKKGTCYECDHCEVTGSCG